MFTPTNIGVSVRFSGVLFSTRADTFVYNTASVLNPVFEWKEWPYCSSVPNTSVEEVSLEDLKLRPIIDQTGTHVYKASKVISKYLEPLSKNEYVINNTLDFPEIIKSVPLQDDEEDV